MTRFAIAAGLLVLASLTPTATGVEACAQPDTPTLTAAFELAADGALPHSYPQIAPSTGVTVIPATILMAIGWVESGWRQFRPDGRPLVSPDFGYGAMQITSGMAGAFGNRTGSVAPSVQSEIASDAAYNIAEGAAILANKWSVTPTIGTGDPGVVEDWYYAIWAYNGWGWTNNPNNPRFNRAGTPVTNPAGFPYQERVLYLVAHPPHGSNGVPLWRPISVSLPPPREVGRTPGPLPQLKHPHDDLPPAYDAVYRDTPPAIRRAGSRVRVRVAVTNTGTAPWPGGKFQLGYDLLKLSATPWNGIPEGSSATVAFGHGMTPITSGVQPGAHVILTVALRAPHAAGDYYLVWDLRDDSGQWLSSEGVMPGIEIVSVGSPPASPTPTPATVTGLRYVADTSLPDGTIVRAGRETTKSWLVFNSGPRSWGAGWTLHHVSGPALGAASIPVPSTRTCRTALITATLRAPARPGTYRSGWRLRDPAGRLTGDVLTVVIKVPSPHPTTTPTPTPTSTQTAAATATPVG